LKEREKREREKERDRQRERYIAKDLVVYIAKKLRSDK
jgi:hypothetical protein